MSIGILKIGSTKDYQSVVDSETRVTSISGTITKLNGSVINISNDIIAPGCLYITNQCVNGEACEFGTVFAGELGATLKLDDDRI